MNLKVLTLFVFFAIIFFQVSVMPNFFSFGFSPNLLLIFLIFFTAEIGFSQSWKWAIFGGLVVDIMFFSLPGTSAISFLSIAYVTDFAAKRFLSGQRIWKIFILSVLSFFALFFNNIISFLLVKSVNYFYNTNYHEYFSLALFFKSAFSNFLLAVILYWPFRKIKDLIIFRQEIKL